MHGQAMSTDSGTIRILSIDDRSIMIPHPMGATGLLYQKGVVVVVCDSPTVISDCAARTSHRGPAHGRSLETLVALWA